MILQCMYTIQRKFHSAAKSDWPVVSVLSSLCCWICMTLSRVTALIGQQMGTNRNISMLLYTSILCLKYFVGCLSS